jgi:hypothetical protein
LRSCRSSFFRRCLFFDQPDWMRRRRRESLNRGHLCSWWTSISCLYFLLSPPRNLNMALEHKPEWRNKPRGVRGAVIRNPSQTWTKCHETGTDSAVSC